MKPGPGAITGQSGRAPAVRVRAPARLHFGFLDLHGGLGRRFGCVGLALEEPALDLVVSPGLGPASDGPEAKRLARTLAAAAEFLHVPADVGARIDAAIPAHAGFGSGTQLALAVAVGLARLNGVPFDARTAAGALDRGNRSGIGVAAFQDGGLVVDGGRGPDGAPPPAIARLPFPEAWRILLILDEGHVGLHGADETAAFRTLPPFPEAEAAHLCRLTLMRILPAVATGDIEAFGRGIAELQRRVGDYFAPFQGGRFASPAVAQALAAAEAAGVAGVGQSSWGPTGFAVLPSEAEAERLVPLLRRTAAGGDRLRYRVVRGRNRGHEITEITETFTNSHPNRQDGRRP